MKSPSQNEPSPSMKKQRSASPSQAMPRSAPAGAHPVFDQLAVLRQQWVRLVVGELSVGLEVHLVQLQPQAAQAGADHRPRHAVAAVDDDLQRLDRVGVNERERVRSVFVPDVDLLEGAAAGGGAKSGFDLAPHIADAGFTRQGQRPLADELDAGVGLRVVGGGHHGAAVQLARADQVVEHLGRDHARVEHRRALEDQPVAQLRRHRRRRQAHVTAKADPQLARLLAAQPRQHTSEGAADGKRRRLVHFLAVEATDVVSLEDLTWGQRGDLGHLKTLLSAPRSSARASAASLWCRR